VVESEDVDEALIALIHELDIDVLVVGSHGGNAFAGLLGSTGSKMVRRSPVPVLVIR